MLLTFFPNPLLFRVRRLGRDHLFTFKNTLSGRPGRADWETGRCPLLPGGVGQLMVQALGLSTTQPYLLLWALYCQQSGASNVATHSLLGALGFLPTSRWVKPGLGAVRTNPVSSCGYDPVNLLLCTYL